MMEDTLGMSHSRHFFDDIDNHKEALEKLPYYREALSEITFQTGKKLTLEVTVDDPSMSSYLYTWLHGKDENGNRLLPFGCTLESIHLDVVDKEALRQKLTEMLDLLK